MLNTQSPNMSPMMKAFMEQSNLDNTVNDTREALISKIQETEYNKALKQMSISGDVFSNICLSSGVNDKTQIHPRFSSYDHSLEKDRLEECKITPGNRKMNGLEDCRPVERDGKIEYESTLTIDELLKRT